MLLSGKQKRKIVIKLRDIKEQDKLLVREMRDIKYKNIITKADKIKEYVCNTISLLICLFIYSFEGMTVVF